MIKKQPIGYFKYSGEPVKEGLWGTRQSAEALLGFDEVLRFFLLKEDPNLSNYSFEIPVRTNKGSWMIEIPKIIEQVLSPEGVLTYYFYKTAKQAAEKGLFQTGLAKDIQKIITLSFKAIPWVIKTAHHVKGLGKDSINRHRIEVDINDSEMFVKIPNDQNQYLKVSKKHYDLFLKCPKDLFAKNAKLIDSTIKLEVGFFENGVPEKVSISNEEKDIFYISKEAEENKVVLPELKNGERIELEGQIVIVTESNNSAGFKYKEYTLICKPKNSKISKYKKQNYLKRKSEIFFKKSKN